MAGVGVGTVVAFQEALTCNNPVRTNALLENLGFRHLHATRLAVQLKDHLELPESIFPTEISVLGVIEVPMEDKELLKESQSDMYLVGENKHVVRNMLKCALSIDDRDLSSPLSRYIKTKLW